METISLLVQIKKSVSLRLHAATTTGTVAMDQMNNAVSIVHFFFTFVVGLAYPTPKVMSK